jgi:hypothetical protein
MIGFGQGQVNCSLLAVTTVVIDNTNMTTDIAVYNGDTMNTHYPFIAYTIDDLGDTIQSGNINWFVTPALDTSWYSYILSSSVIPAYPLSIYFVYLNFTGPNPGNDTCILSYDPSCDSVIVSFNQIDTTTTPDLIYFDVQVFGYGPSVGYPGFVLLNSVGDTIAYENFNTAPNVFTLMANIIETRFLEVVQNFSLPFSGTLHLVDSWFAGNPATACIYLFNISIGTTDISEIINARKLLKITDLLGREVDEKRNRLLFYIYNDGTVEKKIVIE